MGWLDEGHQRARASAAVGGCWITTMTQQQWQNDDSKQNEDLCVLENAKGMGLTPNFKGGLVLMLPCAKLSFLWRWFFSFTQASESEGDRVLLGILYLREYRSDWVLVNEGGCLPPKCSPLWSCLNVVHDGAAVLDAMLLYGVGTTKAMCPRRLVHQDWQCLRYNRPR